MPNSFYFPTDDAEFDSWFSKFHAFFSGNFANWGFTQTDESTLTAAWHNWHGSWTAFQGSQDTFSTGNKNAHRTTAEAVINSFVTRLQSSAHVSSSDWESLGVSWGEAA